MKIYKEKVFLAFYLIIYLAIALSIACKQPLHDTLPHFQNPPDEHSRYLVPRYICEHGVIPTGYEEEIMEEGLPWTYGFYCLLPYMAQGYTMRIVNIFTDSEVALLLSARFVNVAFGFIMAIVVYLLARELWTGASVWLFSCFVTFLPESLFMHTYVNPDSLCMLSTALMIYGVIRCYKTDFSLKASLCLALGVILCTLSYYNAYGTILAAILCCVIWHIKNENGKIKVEWNKLIKRALLISLVVIVFSGWHFIRNYIVYDGDILGIDAKEAFISQHGLIRETWQSKGASLWDMIFGTDYWFVLRRSFIAAYGSMSMFALGRVYKFYYAFICLGYVSYLIFGIRKVPKLIPDRRWISILSVFNMFLCFAITLGLSFRYSYTIDMQPQGRYILPGIVPFAYFLAEGFDSIPEYGKYGKKIKYGIQILMIIGIFACLYSMIFQVAMPMYNLLDGIL